MKTIILSCLVALPLFSEHGGDQTKRIHESATVIGEIMSTPDKSIPQDLLSKAECVGVVPSLKRAGFIIGAKFGKGVLTCRTENHAGWTAPSIVRVEGGSVGLQIGAGETDVVFIVMNRSGINKLMKDKFTLGADASVMAGPVGRSGEARTDPMMRAEILSWSRSRGLFAGISLDGATLRPDNDDNAKMYGRAVTHEELLNGRVAAAASARELFDQLNRYAPYKKSTD